VGIDWFTFVAQILNFVILLFLLKRFLYRPVLDAIAGREDRIRSRLEDAHRMEEKAEAEGRALREERAALEARRSELLRQAEREAEERREALAEEVRVHVRKVREDWTESLHRQSATFLEELRRRVGRATYALAARVVRDLADADLEDRAIEVFLERLRSLEEADRNEFLEEAAGRIGVRSAFPMTGERRQKIERAVRAWVGADTELHFEEDPELALGIEMRGGDRKVGWSVGSYLEELEAEASRYLEAEAG
jgi:F-type H+-transporting ATPase subunit b